MNGLENTDNLYNILNIKKDATIEEIKKAYRRLALKFHPDKNKSPEANEMFKKINDAHNYLIDDTKREFFNKFGKRMDDENQEN
jgi:DnaJ-class molecular chaperone